MQVFIFTSIIFFFVSTLFITLFLINKNKYHKLESDYQNLNSIHKNLNTSYQNLVNKFNSFSNEFFVNKNGYYEDSVNLISPEDRQNGKSGDLYKCTIFVKELDRYTNGMSKLELINIEVVSGFDVNQYSWVKKTLQNKFSSLKKTSDIEWLESETEIKELRKQKLDKLSDLLKEE